MKPMTEFAQRVALIHATPVAVQPVAEAFGRLWPQASLMNLLDDSLSGDLAAKGQLDAGMTQRFVDLAEYAVRTGAQGVLFTCSAFGPAIEAAARAVDVPTYKPNEAMFLEALDVLRTTGGRRIGLLSTFEPSIAPMREEMQSLASKAGVDLELVTVCATGALAALNAGDAATHDRLVVERSSDLEHCDVVMLGQFSMARAQALVARHLGKSVLTSPDSAVRLLRKNLLNA